MLRLTQQCDVVRWVTTSGVKRSKAIVHPRIGCLVIPISQADQLIPYARESTHRVFLPRWFRDVRTEDELVVGRRALQSGAIEGNRFIVGGVRSFVFGLQHTEAFVREST